MSTSYRLLSAAAFGSVVATGWCATVRPGQRAATNVASLRCTVVLESPPAQRVAVVLAIDGIDPTREKLRWTMPQRFAFVRLAEPLLDGPVRATTNGTPLDLKRVGPYEWDVAVAGRKSMRLEYVVPLTHRTLDVVKQRDAYEYPYLADDHGLLVTPTLFMFPEDVEVSAIRVRFDLPEGWQVVAPWRRVAGPAFDPGDREALLNDLVAVGAWHVHQIRVGRFEGTIAVAPGQDDLEDAVVEPIRRIVECELKLFGRPAEGRYLFVFGRPETPGMAGSPKSRSMTLSVEPRLASKAEQYLPHLIAHEFFHTWAERVEMPGELRWFNEGFTDYYAYLVPARLRLKTWEDFANTLADKMRRCAANPLRGKLSLAEAGGEVFFHDQNAYDLVYDGGLLIGAWLDRAIRTRDGRKTLDDLMRAFNNDPRWSTGEVAPTLEDFVAVARQCTDEATATALERFVTQPYRFDPVAAFAGVGVAVRHAGRPPKMDLRANLDGTRVIDIDRSSITYQVGVRPADRFVEINGQAVSNAREVRAAWRQPVGQRIRITLRRDGREVKINCPLPQVERFVVPLEPWREHE